MAATAFALQRLYQQRLAHNPLASAADVVTWFGAVQAQEYLTAKWSLGIRMAGATDAEIEQAFNAGEILRTHVMRPTWHFVAPADIRWLLELTAPRVHTVNGHMYRQLNLDVVLLTRACEVLIRALEGGRHLTRPELGEALAQAGIAADGMRLGYIVHYAELEALICSGPRRGKQFTYALIDERAPQAQSLPRDQALAELTLRYFTGHGPARARDFAWWSGLTVADVKTGIAMVGSRLVSEEIDGQTFWRSPDTVIATEAAETAYLLPTYDEYVIGYAGFGASRGGGMDLGGNLAFDATIVYEGRIIGSWRRTFSKGAVVIELAPFSPLTDAQAAAVRAAGERFGAFLGMPVVWA